jgi:hypothetical protein
MPLDKEFVEYWLKTMPKVIQETAAKYPPDSTLNIKGETLYVIGYTEGGDLMASTTSPSVDYNKALETKVYLCAGCLAGDPEHVH